MAIMSAAAPAIGSPPRVSVIIPLYQSERFVAATLASVLAQTIADIDVIVIDDGSTDRGPELARATGDPRVIVVTQPNAGVSAARNHGLRLASAPIVAFIDADDLWEPNKLEAHLAHLAARPDLHITWVTTPSIAFATVNSDIDFRYTVRQT